ncbi:D-alanyl-D-alanine carboxypeptidase/D-alanyl-D-alanine endopeptidase [Longivirga aurantiaca]|uniref:D-alanyl-D-alanine carboxypeptidase/D-alanyl-D-alanine-endopeptidase n=1 Tax=Longivirga aurantiaca TaxID=1837743 RepID=A0ABW1SZP0_9ACTN
MSSARRPALAAACALALALPVLVGGSAAGAPTAVPAPPAAPAVVLPVADGAPSPAPTTSDKAMVAAVAKALRAAPLGSDTTAIVLDVASGDVIVGDDETRAQVPASTAKTLTAVTALSALGPSTRLRTAVVTGATAGEIVLVGGGDATLTRTPAKPGQLPAGQAARPASLSDLARATAKALKASGITAVSVRIDDSAFRGPRTAAGWPDSYVSTGVVSPVSALSADSGRVSADSRVRDTDPALAAGRYFADRLATSGIAVSPAVTRTVAAAGATPIASVLSPTVADLVERMLTDSDNDLAEALAHLAGGKLVGDPSFAGGATATLQVVEALGVPTTGLALSDGSGLSRRDAVSARTLAGVLAAAARDEPPVGTTAGILWPTSTGLPIAGVTGTLAERFDTPGTDPGRGVVRAKTGTLSGVVTLAGMTRDSEGRLRVFAFLADASPGPLLDAQAALDRAAAAVAAG